MSPRNQGRKVLRALAEHVAEIASQPVQQETIALWTALNGLKPSRPMVLIDQIPWHEMDVDAELTLESEDAFQREIEASLRRTIYSWKHMRADMVVEPVLRVSKVIRRDDFGIDTHETTLAGDPDSEILSHSYVDQLRTDTDVDRIRSPRFHFDERATAEAEEKAHEIFDGILEVRMQGCLPSFELWDQVVRWRGAENVLLDLADRPAFMHRIITRLTDANLAMVDELERNGLLGWGQPAIHCTGAFTDELPAPGFDACQPRAQDLWTYGMAQIFASVSHAMFEEFELGSATLWAERFGLVYYGCCEPLHDRIDLIRRIPHVRKISMSPFADVAKGAEGIGRDFVFSRKPSPAPLAFDAWRPDLVETDLRKTLDACARFDCPLEIILKDISTVRHQPQRLWAWATIAMRLIGQ